MMETYWIEGGSGLNRVANIEECKKTGVTIRKLLIEDAQRRALSRRYTGNTASVSL